MPERSAYRVILTPDAPRRLGRIPPNIRQRLVTRLTSLGSTPRPAGVRALEGPARLLRLRVGDYRIVYSVEDVSRTIRIVRVGHRRDVYRGL